MSTTTRIEIPATTTPADLPAGWSYGAHTSGAGWSGYHLIHESGVSVVAVERPDLDADDVDLVEVLGEAISGEDAEATLVVSYRDQDGFLQEASAESLEGLAAELASQGYDGPSLTVPDAAGFTRGWVSAGQWRAS